MPAWLPETSACGWQARSGSLRADLGQHDSRPRLPASPAREVPRHGAAFRDWGGKGSGKNRVQSSQDIFQGCLHLLQVGSERPAIRVGDLHATGSSREPAGAFLLLLQLTQDEPLSPLQPRRSESATPRRPASAPKDHLSKLDERVSPAMATDGDTSSLPSSRRSASRIVIGCGGQPGT